MFVVSNSSLHLLKIAKKMTKKNKIIFAVTKGTDKVFCV